MRYFILLCKQNGIELFSQTFKFSIRIFLQDIHGQIIRIFLQDIHGKIIRIFLQDIHGQIFQTLRIRSIANSIRWEAIISI